MLALWLLPFPWLHRQYSLLLLSLLLALWHQPAAHADVFTDAETALQTTFPESSTAITAIFTLLRILLLLMIATGLLIVIKISQSRN